MTTDALTYARVLEHLAKLKLDRIAAVVDQLAQEAAAGEWPYLAFLDRLLDEEVATRLARAVEMRTKGSHGTRPVGSPGWPASRSSRR